MIGAIRALGSFGGPQKAVPAKRKVSIWTLLMMIIGLTFAGAGAADAAQTRTWTFNYFATGIWVGGVTTPFEVLATGSITAVYEGEVDGLGSWSITSVTLDRNGETFTGDMGTLFTFSPSVLDIYTWSFTAASDTETMVGGYYHDDTKFWEYEGTEAVLHTTSGSVNVGPAPEIDASVALQVLAALAALLLIMREMFRRKRREDEASETLSQA